MAVMVSAYYCLGNEKKKSYTVLDMVTQDKRSLARPRRRWEYEVGISLKENLCNANGLGMLGSVYKPVVAGCE